MKRLALVFVLLLAACTPQPQQQTVTTPDGHTTIVYQQPDHSWLYYWAMTAALQRPTVHYHVVQPPARIYSTAPAPRPVHGLGVPPTTVVQHSQTTTIYHAPPPRTSPAPRPSSSFRTSTSFSKPPTSSFRSSSSFSRPSSGSSFRSSSSFSRRR